MLKKTIQSNVYLTVISTRLGMQSYNGKHTIPLTHHSSIAQTSAARSSLVWIFSPYLFQCAWPWPSEAPQQLFSLKLLPIAPRARRGDTVQCIVSHSGQNVIIIFAKALAKKRPRARDMCYTYRWRSRFASFMGSFLCGGVCVYLVLD